MTASNTAVNSDIVAAFGKKGVSPRDMTGSGRSIHSNRRIDPKPNHSDAGMRDSEGSFVSGFMVMVKQGGTAINQNILTELCFQVGESIFCAIFWCRYNSRATNRIFSSSLHFLFHASLSVWTKGLTPIYIVTI
jgi:hypothetical protein